MNAGEVTFVTHLVTFACRAGLAALVVSLSSTTASAQIAPDQPQPKPEPPRVVSSTDLAYIDGAIGVYRGTSLVGVGSREPYVGFAIEGDLLLTSMITRRLGLDLGVYIGDAATQSGHGDEYFGRMELAAVTPLVKRDGPRGYSALVGAGAGVTVGRFWWADVRVYPYALARFTYLVTRSKSIFAEAALAPIDTSLVAHTWAVESRFEMGAAIDLFFVGARVALTTIEGGDPSRTYGDLGVTFYLGVGARFAPARSVQ